MLALVLLCAAILPCAGQSRAVQEAVAAIQKGEFAAAERSLRPEAQAHPDDAWTLSLLAYSLDYQQRTQEAEEFHLRALAEAPHSAGILNNYGTHLWILKDYARAESVFAEALAAAPAYFSALYNLGVMATNTGHYERACEVLESALRQQPNNVDVLYHLAAAEEFSKRWEAAARHLAEAARLDPRRDDVQMLLAVTTGELGALADSAAAWDRYLALKPDDDTARRERAYNLVKLGKLEEGAAGIEQYVGRHPRDKVGYYELAQAERGLDSAKALEHFGRALAIDPAYVAALSARGSLYYQDGKFEPALRDLEAATALEAGDAATWDRLAQTYQAVDRTADAVRALRKAADLAPSDPKIVLHFGRALADAGQDAESKAVMERFRELGPEKKNIVPEGLVDYLALTSGQRRADYRARIEKAIQEHPDDAAAQVAYLKLLVEAGENAKLVAAARRVAALKASPALLADAGQALLAAKHYDLARDLLGKAGADSGVLVGYAVATFRALPGAATAKQGLGVLDRVPDSQRDAEWFLARATMLDAAGREEEAVAAAKQAGRQPKVIARAAAFLNSKHHAAEALALLDTRPDDREILLMRATTLEALHRTGEAESSLNQIRSRWPEWPAVWAGQGIVLAAHGQFAEAAKALEGAVALGAHGSEMHYFLAKSYDALGKKAEAQAARSKIPSADRTTSEASWLDRVFGGALVEK